MLLLKFGCIAVICYFKSRRNTIQFGETASYLPYESRGNQIWILFLTGKITLIYIPMYFVNKPVKSNNLYYCFQLSVIHITQ